MKKKIFIDVLAAFVVVWCMIASAIALVETLRCAELAERCDAYEHALDRIYADNPDYYVDVFMETDEFQDLHHKREK